MGMMTFSSITFFNFSSYFTSLALLTSFYSIYFVLISANVSGFDSLIQLLPPSASLRNAIRKSETIFRVDDFGAVGDGFTDDTNSFKDVWHMACSSPSRSKIVIPTGYVFLVRPINFGGPCRSKVSLRIEGTILAPKDPEVWNGLNPRRWLYFFKVKHLTVEGGGNIDGMGQEWWARSCKVNRTNPCHHAPTEKKNLFDADFHRDLLNNGSAGSAGFNFPQMQQPEISKLVILAPADSPNTDAIHISSCTKVNVKDCTIGTGDDCISIVGNSSRIKVNNIVCAPGHGISIGSLGKSNSWGQVYNVHVNGAFISNTENGVRIKTWQGGSGYVRKVTFKNVWMENVSNPIIIDQYYCDSMEPCANQTSNIGIDKVSFVGIKGTSATEKAITIACSDSFPCRKLYLEDVQLTSFSGDYTTSFCWQAYGSTSGLNYPPPCFPCNDNILRPTVSSNWIRSI